jgi:MFS family permease
MSMIQRAAFPGVGLTEPAVLGEAAAPAALRRKWAVLLVLLAAPFLAVLDAFVVLVAVPSIQDQLHASDAGVQLVVAGYGVAYAAFLIAGGRLGDIHGRRKLLVVGFVLFAGTSLLGAAAPNEDVLVLARVLQGASAALMYPQTLALIRVHFTGRDLGVAMAAFGMTLGGAAVAAQLVGGFVVQTNILGFGWRAIFVVALPIGVLATGLALLLVPESRAGGAPRLDLAGVALVTAGLLALVFPLIVGRQLGWPLWTWPLAAGAGLLGGLFVVHQRRLARRGRAPLVSLDLFRVRSIVVGLAMTLVFYGGQVSFWLLLTLYLQHGLGLSPLNTGLVFTPVALGFFAASLVSPALAQRAGRHVLTGGALGLAAGTGALSELARDAAGSPALPMLLPVLFACGLGFGLVIPSLVTLVLRVVPTDYEGAASGVLVTAQQVAGAVGVALSGILFFGLLHRPLAYASSFALALGLNVVLFVATALLAQVVRDAR